MAGETAPVSDRAAAWAIAIIVAAAAALRVYELNAQLWYDEILTLIRAVRMPFVDIVTHFPTNNNHVFYSALANLSIAAWGEHPWTLRLPAALFGVGSVYMIYRFGRLAAGRFEALLAALISALSYHHIWFSQNARGYTILLFVMLLSTYLLLVGLRDNRRAAFIAFGIVAAFGVYTHLTMLFAVVGQALVVAGRLLVSRRGRIVLADWINPAIGFVVAALVTLALYAPLMGDIQSFFTAEQATGAAKNPATPGWAMLETLRGLNLETWWLLAAGLIVAVYGGVSYLRQSLTMVAFFVVPVAVVLAAAVLLDRPTFPRFFFFVAGFAILVAIRGVMVWARWLGKRTPIGTGRMQWLAAAALTAIALVMLPPAYRAKQDYDGALAYLEANARPTDAVRILGIGAAMPFQSYYEKPWPRLSSEAELAQARAAGPTWVVYTLPKYIEVSEPGLLKTVERDCARQEFHGTLAGGVVVVARCPALS